MIKVSGTSSDEADAHLAPWVLVIAPERGHQAQLEAQLAAEGYAIESVECAEAAIASLAVITPAFILIHPTVTGEDRHRIERYLEHRGHLPTIPVLPGLGYGTSSRNYPLR